MSPSPDLGTDPRSPTQGEGTHHANTKVNGTAPLRIVAAARTGADGRLGGSQLVVEAPGNAVPHEMPAK